MRIASWLLAILCFSLLFAGCYTILVHPTVDTTSGYHQTARHCSDCHASADFYYWHYPYYYNSYGRRSYWRSYYYDPWWWDDYWYWRDDDEGGSGLEQRHLWQPRTPPERTPAVVPETSPQYRPEVGPDVPSTGTPSKQEQPAKKRLFQPRKPPPKKEAEPKEKEPPKQEEKKAKDSQ